MAALGESRGEQAQGWLDVSLRAAALGESGGEQAQGLVLVSRQGGAVAVEVAGDAAAGGARAVTECLYASLSLKLCKGERAAPG